MPRRSQPVALAGMPSTFRFLVQAAESECPPGHAEALGALASLAFRKVPARGIFDPGNRDEDGLFTEIDAIAIAHLDLTSARTAWHAALENADLPFQKRDTIETTALRVQDVSDTVYFYAGLAFGLAFVSLSRSS